MAKRKGQQTEQLNINLTPSQSKAVKLALLRAERNYLKPVSKNDILLQQLRHLCEAYDVEWPEIEKRQGD